MLDPQPLQSEIRNPKSEIRYYCTYFDQHYLPRGLALYHSLIEHCPEFLLWVLCMDDACHRILSEMKLPGIYPIALEDFERGDASLLEAKQNRSRVEYYFTCSPSLPLYILKHWPDVDLITYLDADLFFFANPAPLYDEMNGCSIAIIGHRFPPKLRHLEVHGLYNVGWLSFRRDENALTCLQWWRERCIEWCYDRVEAKRFGDQKYLDEWPQRFPGVVILQHKGANVAPWNLANYHVHRVHDAIWVDDQPLIFFHFHGLKRVRQWLYDPNLSGYHVKPTLTLRRSVYAVYLRTLRRVTEQVVPLMYEFPSLDSIRRQVPRTRPSSCTTNLLHPIADPLRKGFYLIRGILMKRYLLTLKGYVLW